jgi:hypothetical protein
MPFAIGRPPQVADVVDRTAACTWVFHAGGVGELDARQAFMKSGVRKGRVDEGLFYMPFEMTFIAQGGC